jgi:hypothetical protein
MQQRVSAVACPPMGAVRHKSLGHPEPFFDQKSKGEIAEILSMSYK